MTQTAFFAPATGVDVMLQKAAGGPPPADPIGDPYVVGSTTGAATANVKRLTTTNAVAAGDLILPRINTRSAVTSLSITDQVGNTYTVQPRRGGGLAGQLWRAQCINAIALPAGSWIDIATNDPGYLVARVDAIPNAHLTSPIDVDVGPSSVATTSGSFALGMGPFGTADDEIVIEDLTFYDGRVTTVTPSTGFTLLGATVGTADDYRIQSNWKRQQATTAVTLDASWVSNGAVGSQTAAINARSFKGK